MKKIYCGKSIQDKCTQQRHPVNEVKAAIEFIQNADPMAYSNNTDFVSAAKHIGLKQGVEIEFFLDGISKGNDIEEIFKDFNEALDMISELSQ